MILKHRFLLTSGFAILSVAVLLSGTLSSTRSSAATKHHRAIQVRHPLYNSYTAPVAPIVPVVPVVRPGCYLPSDGCLNEYSVQN
jgi:hypothetical protein